MTNSQRFERAVLRADIRSSVTMLEVGRWSVRISQDNKIIIVFIDNQEGLLKIYKPRLCRGGVVKFPYTPAQVIPTRILNKSVEILRRKKDIQDRLEEDYAYLPHMAREIFAVTIQGEDGEVI